SSFDFAYYIGKLYYYELGKANFTDPIGTTMLFGDLKLGVLSESELVPALAGGLWGGFVFSQGRNAGQAQSLQQFGSQSLFNFFSVASKRVADSGVHAGFFWGNLPALTDAIN